MWRFRFTGLLVLPLLTGTLVLLSGALGQQTPPASQTAPPSQPSSAAPAAAPPAPKADPEAAKALAKAIERLEPKQTSWIDTIIWQSINVQGLSFQAEGRYLSGPERRLHLDLKIKLGGTDGQLQMVSDGTTVWTANRVGSGTQMVVTWDLKKVQQVLNSPNSLPQVGQDFFRSQLMAGLAPLLQNLSTQMTFTKHEKGSWKEHQVVKLTGVWNPEIAKMMTVGKDGWQPSMPRTCALYLDHENYWPHRIEWIGPGGSRGEDTKLMALEFREPHLLKAGEPAPAAYTQAFAFVPAKNAEVKDITKEITDLAQQAQARAASRPR
jgi:hypothetical protein